MVREFSDIDKYTHGFPTTNVPGRPDIFRAAKQCLPGPVSPMRARILLSTGSAAFMLPLHLARHLILCRVDAVHVYIGSLKEPSEAVPRLSDREVKEQENSGCTDAGSPCLSGVTPTRQQ